jgi:hypothetical protein
MQVGDIVRILPADPLMTHATVFDNQIGIVVALAKRLYVPAAKVLVLGDVAEWDQDELELV